MTNVLLIYEDIEPANIETGKVLYGLSKEKYFNYKEVKTFNITRELFEWCDVIFGIRSTSSLEKHLFSYAKKQGIYVIESLDDDFLSLGSDYGSDGQGFWSGRKKALISIIKHTDCLIAVNKYIINKYSKIGNIRKTFISNTPMDIKSFVNPAVIEGRVKIVYYVNDGSTDMFDRYIRPILPFISEKLSDKVSLFFLAVHPDMSQYDGKIDYYYIPHMSFDEFLLYLKKEQFDIGLAPLEDEGFSKSKYINKFIEYTRAGVAGIYSDCELYRHVITDGYNGILCDDTPKSWEDAIQNLVDFPQKRVEIARNAQYYASENLEKVKVLRKLIEGVPELSEYSSPPHSISAIRLFSIKVYYCFLFRTGGWINTLYCCIKNGNTRKIISRFRRKILKQ